MSMFPVNTESSQLNEPLLGSSCIFAGHHPGDFVRARWGLSLGGCVLKRSIDVMVAGLMLMVFFPLLVLCGLLVKLDSRGPALFLQVRMGRDFTPFKLLKFRTMREGESGSA